MADTHVLITYTGAPGVVQSLVAGANVTVDASDPAHPVVSASGGGGGGGGGVTDHGALTGLADDDHTQYHTDARGDARYDALGAAAAITLTGLGGVPTARTVSAGTGLSGGGDLSANRSLAVAYGTAAGTACQGNDSRLSDARTPVAHNQAASTISDSTTAGRALLTGADAAAQRTSLELGTAATTAATDYATAAQGALAASASQPGHVHAASNITSGTVATARLGSGTADGTTYLRGDQTWATVSGGSATQAFGTVAVSGQSDVVADAAPDTLTLAAGSGIAITTNASTDTITIAATGSGVADGATLSTGLTFPNAGLLLRDTNASHNLIVSPGSDLTANRTLTLTTGDANRTLTLTGNVSISGTNTGDQTAQAIATAIDADATAEATLKTALGLGTAAYTASSAYAVAAKGVTNGDSHDHNGGDGATIAYSSLSGAPTSMAPTAHASSHAAAGADPLSLTAAQISDSSAVGRGILTAADGEAARLAIGADLISPTLWARSGWVIGPSLIQQVPTTQAVSPNQLRAVPFVVAKTLVVTTAIIETTTAGSVGATARVGIYTDENAYPASLVADSDPGTFAIDATTTVSNTFAAPITLAPGIYWLSMNVSASATLRAASAAGLPVLLGITETLGATLAKNSYVAAGVTYGALPSTYPAGAVTSQAAFPGPFLKVQ